MFPEIMSDASFSTNEAILTSLRRAGEIIKSKQNADYWMSEEGQSDPLGKLERQGSPERAFALSTTRMRPRRCCLCGRS